MELAIPVVALASIYFVNKFVTDKQEPLSETFENNGNIPDRNYPDQVVSESDLTSSLSVGNRYRNKTGAYTDKYFQPDSDLVKGEYASRGASGKSYSSMLGEKVQGDYFQHNNMVPFFGGKMRTAHTQASANEGILDNYSGTGTQIIDKKEISPLFAPHESLQYAYGAPNQSDFFQSRVNASTKMSNVKPFGEQKVAPGLGLGFTTEGAGGYNSGMAAREQWADRSVDELRVKTNPKASGYGLFGHEGPAASFVTKRGDQGFQEKNRPETAFETGPERLLRTTGMRKGDQQIPDVVQKQVHRADTAQEYAGAAQKAAGSNHYVSGEYHSPHGVELGAYPIQSAVAQGKYVATDGDYSYKSNRAYMNNRSLQQPEGKQNYFGAAGGILTEAIAPLLDILRPSRKENSIGTLRPYQNAGFTVPLAYVYNPKDKTKTTIREMTQDSLMHLQVDANQRGGAYETNPHQPVENARYKTSDNYYAGNASANEGTKQMRPYDAEYRQRNNNLKSSTNVGYATSGNTNVFNNDMNVYTSDNRDKMLRNKREVAPVMPSQSPSYEFQGQNSSNPMQLYSNLQLDRNNGESLSQLKDNPFAVPMLRGL